MRIASIVVLLTFVGNGHTVGQTLAPFAAVKPVLDAFGDKLPGELKNPTPAKWTAWARSEDKAVRARIGQGDLDSMVNLLLFGNSFTKQPRIEVRQMLAGSSSPVLQSRLRDLLDGLRSPAGNERLMFLRSLLESKGMVPDTLDGYEKTGVFILENVRRALQEQIKFGQRIEDARRESDTNLEFVERSRLFRDRGVSLDTSLLPDYGVEEALRDIKNLGQLRQEQVRRVAVIGPGLDFADKESGYDYYPQQTLQPFALYDSLVRLGLAKRGALEVTVFDIASRVLDHLRLARDRAKAGNGYVVQLPRDPARQWLPGTVRYWQTFADQIGASADPLSPPAELNGLQTRAVRIRPDVALSCVPRDMDIVFNRLEMPAAQKFDLIVATNVFVYYDTLEQTLALQNVSAMLKPGGIFLTNNKLSAMPAVRMQYGGSTTVQYAEGATAGDHMLRYQRQ
jgi:SAM-dependent methyltransferase